MIEIYHIVSIMNPAGIETMLMNTFREINKKKYKFVFVVHGDQEGEYEAEILKLGGEIIRAPKFQGYNYLTYKNFWNELFSKLSKNTIIHCHIRVTARIILNESNKYNLSSILHSHSISSGKGFKATIKDAMQFKVGQLPAYRVACTYEAGKWLFGKQFLKNSNDFVWYNAIKVEDFLYDDTYRTEIRNAYGVDEDTFLIGTVARFHKDKNHDFLIRVFNNIIKEFPDKKIKIMLVGGGDEQKRIEELVYSLNLENRVIFTGNQTDVNIYYNAFDIFMLPSLYEGLGIVYVEAQINGLFCMGLDNLPVETDLGLNLIKYMSEDIGAWLNVFREKYNNRTNRQNVSYSSVPSNYDITIYINEIENFYLKVTKGKI